MKILNRTRLFSRFLDNHAPDRFMNRRVQEIWLDYLKPYVDEIHLDNYGSALQGVINPSRTKGRDQGPCR